MGVWYEMILACRLKSDVPSLVIETLNSMIEPLTPLNEILPQHPLFTKYTWRDIFSMDSLYFPGQPYASLAYQNLLSCYELTLRIKNKYKDELVAFLDWIVPYSSIEGFVGYLRADEDNEITLLYFNKGKLQTKNVG